MRNNDADLIAAALTDRLESVLDTFAPGWVEYRGKGYPNATGKRTRDLGSFVVGLKGPRRGTWYRFSLGLGGGPVKLLAFLLNGQVGEPTREDYRRAFDEARRFLGMEAGSVDHAAVRRAKVEAQSRRQKAARQEAWVAKRKQESAAAIWAEGVPIQGTPAEVYLRRRDIDLPEWPDALRFVGSVHHEGLDTFAPALVCRVDDAGGEFTAVWRIFLTEDGEKAFGSESKRGRGPAQGGAIRLFPPAGGEIALCEGVETALAIRCLTHGSMPIWSAMSTAGIIGFRVPPGIERVRVFPDHDTPKRGISPGLDAAERFRARGEEEGIRVIVDRSAPLGRDHNDVLRAFRRAARRMEHSW